MAGRRAGRQKNKPAAEGQNGGGRGNHGFERSNEFLCRPFHDTATPHGFDHEEPRDRYDQGKNRIDQTIDQKGGNDVGALRQAQAHEDGRFERAEAAGGAGSHAHHDSDGKHEGEQGEGLDRAFRHQDVENGSGRSDVHDSSEKLDESAFVRRQGKRELADLRGALSA